MAASVDNRQFMDPSSVNSGPALLRPIKPGPILHHLEPLPRLVDDSFNEDDDDDGDEDDDYSSYIEEIIFKSREGGIESSLLDPRDESTADNWIERHPSMVRLTGKHPFNAEAPIDHLMRHGFITPVPLHYVRNHGYVPKGTWHEWTVEVTGLVKHPRVFTLDQLVSEFPSRELPVTLVCAGNRRREQNMTKQTKGFNWGAAGVSTSVWRGVPLHAVLKRCGILKPNRGGLNVCFEGAEDLPGGGGSKYGTSLPRGVAMDPTRDVIIAYMQNGERLKPDHGFPLRMIIPGHIGGRMVKWLKRIVVTPKESDNFYHYKDNRVLPSHVDLELADEQGWWYKPEHIINELNINSAITTPCHEELLPVSTWTIQKAYTLKGYAYSGGGRKVTRVEVTLDGGETWQMCELDHPERPTPHGKYWCWCFWRCDVEVLELVVTKEIAVRAWDESHNTQPEKLIWNLMGMMNNCWFRVKANVCRPHQGEIGILFEHPTVPGNQQGGWMAKQKPSGSENQTLKKSVSTPMMVTSSEKFPMSVVEAHNTPESPWIIVHGHVYDCTRFLKDHPGGSDSILINAGTDCTEEFDAIHSDKAKALLEDYRIGELQTTSDSTPVMVTSSEKFPMSVVKAHNSPESPWIIVHGHIYDCTRFLKDHPGGADSIVINAGTDCTEEFDAIHSDKAKALLEDYRIGELQTTSDSTVSSTNSSIHGVSNFTHLPPITEAAPAPACSVALIPREKIRCKLVKKTVLSHDVRIFRFALPSEDQVLGLPVGKHVFLCATIDGKLCMRAYTPTSDIDEVGHFDLLIKVYFKNVHPDYPNGGLMSQYLESLPLHSVIEVKGPLGHIEYVGRGKFMVHGKPRLTTKLAMIAGGTGITPIYQVIQAVMKDPTDRTEMYVVYANRTEDDILLGEQLDEWSRNDERLKVWYVVSKSIRGGWNYSLGRINEEIMREHLPQGSDDTLALACGPPGMIQSTAKPILEKMKYNVKDSFLVF